MKIKLLVFILFAISISSCQQISRWLDITPTEDFDSFIKRGQFCSNENELQIIGTNPLANKQFQSEILAKMPHADFYTLATMMTLFQMDIRPEQSSPYSRLQFFIFENNTWKYFDFNSINQDKEKTNFPYMQGLDWLAKKTKSGSLRQIAEQVDKSLPKFIFVGPVFSKWLEGHKDQFIQNDLFREHFFKGDQVVVYGESVKPLNHGQIVKNYSNSKVTPQFFSNLPFYEETENSKAWCNFDPKIYNEMILGNVDPKPINANVFGFQDNKGRAFIGISMLKNPTLPSSADQFLLQAENPIRPVSFCFNQTKTNSIVLIGNGGIDPAQHIMQIRSLSLESVDDLAAMEQRMMQSRTLFLVQPARMAVETKLINDQQLAELHHYQLPVYHADHLGEIWSWIKTNKASGFVADPRYERGVLCQ